MARARTGGWVVRRSAGLMPKTRLRRVGLTAPSEKAALPLTEPRRDRCEDDTWVPPVCGQVRTVSDTVETPTKLKAELTVLERI